MGSVRANRMERAFAVDADVLYQWKNLVPTYKDYVSLIIKDIYMRDARCRVADGIYQINGDNGRPVETVNIDLVDTNESYMKNDILRV